MGRWGVRRRYIEVRGTARGDDISSSWPRKLERTVLKDTSRGEVSSFNYY